MGKSNCFSLLRVDTGKAKLSIVIDHSRAEWSCSDMHLPASAIQIRPAPLYDGKAIKSAQKIVHVFPNPFLEIMTALFHKKEHTAFDVLLLMAFRPLSNCLNLNDIGPPGWT